MIYLIAKVNTSTYKKEVDVLLPIGTEVILKKTNGRRLLGYEVLKIKYLIDSIELKLESINDERVKTDDIIPFLLESGFVKQEGE